MSMLAPLFLKAQSGKVEHIMPDGLNKPKAYTHVVSVTGNHKTILIAGQVSADAQGNVVGKGDLKAQGEQVFKNLQTALAAAGADLKHIVKWNIYLIAGQNIEDFRAVRAKVWGDRPNPPASTLVFVPALASPDYLLEIECTAIVPQ